MDFTSIIFPLFLLIVFSLWKTSDFSRGKIILMLASFFFYSYWFPPYLLLLLTSGGIDYWASKKIEQSKSKHAKKKYLLFSLCTNLSILGFYKYTNFFLEICAGLGGFLTGKEVEPYVLHVILPIGISFYTFQSISYTVDVYRGKLAASSNYLDFFLYLSFFPQLVAGPIVRAIDFLPQLTTRKTLDWKDYHFSLYRICRGYFLKVYIADQISRHTNSLFAYNVNEMGFSYAWVAALCFSVQIFCDFSGYSDIAIGVSRLFGFRIRENFNNPYFAHGIEDFWRRWHISLSTWFRDYVYIPLGGNRISKTRTELNVMAVFVVSGFWHGANWTFILWGVCHGVLVFTDKAIRQLSFANQFSRFPLSSVFIRLVTLIIVVFLWVPFRAPDISFTLQMWGQMLFFTEGNGVIPSRALYIISLFCIYCCIQFTKEILRVEDTFWIQRVETAIYFGGILMAPWTHTDFIYFQF